MTYYYIKYMVGTLEMKAGPFPGDQIAYHYQDISSYEGIANVEIVSE